MPMDWKIARPNCRCASSGRSLQPGESFYSVLIRGSVTIERLDYAVDAWQGPPEKSLGWWRSQMPATEAHVSTLAPPDVLLDAMESLESQPNQQSLRYTLSLLLVRRRVLRIMESFSGEGASGVLVLSCRRRDCEYRVVITSPSHTEAEELETKLGSLIWSGAAA